MRFERKTNWTDAEFLETSYEGGAEYIDAHLLKHPRESAENFARRKKLAVYVNYCAPIADLYTQYLFRETVARDLTGIDEQTAKAYMADADMAGRTHAQIVRLISRMAGVSGSAGVLIDKPAAQATSRADAIKHGLRPYAVIYEAEAVYEYEFTRQGGRKALTRLVLEDARNIFKVWQPDVIETWDQTDGRDARLIETVPNPLGMIPFVMHRNRDTIDADYMRGESDIKSIAAIAKKVFEIDAQIAEITDNTAFPMLAGPVDAGSSTNQDGEVIVGTGSFLEERPGDPQYRYVEPSHTSLSSLWTIRAGYVDEIYKLARNQAANATQNKQAKSGIALEIEFQEMNAILSEKAEQCEKLENTMLQFVAAWEGQTYDGYVEYPRRFGIRDLSSDIDMAIKAKMIVPAPTFSKAVAVDFAARVLREPEQETLDAIGAELSVAEIVPDEIDANRP